MSPRPDNSEAAVRRRLVEEAREVALAAKRSGGSGSGEAQIHPAASVIVVRDAAPPEELSVLLARRSQDVRFMPGAWVFPGGRLDQQDGGGGGQGSDATLAAFQACATREAHEEVGLELPDSSKLVWFSHWITPQGLPHRFDTRFFLAAAPAESSPEPDGHEVDEARWITPSAAIDANEADDMTIFFPTLKQLERLVGVATFTQATEIASAEPITPVTPRVLVEDGVPRVVLPDEPGYDKVPPL